MELLIIFLVLAIGVSFICSILEAVLLSVSDSFVAMLEEEGASHAEQLRKMKEDIDRPLATILSLNTIAHTVGAAGVGAQAQRLFGEASITLVSTVLTLLILFLSEIIPKTLGARFWRQLTHPTVWLLQVLMIILSPLVWVCQKITGLISRSGDTKSFSRKEFAAMATRGAEEGVLAQSEATTFKNLVFIESLTAHDVMTPRTVVHSIKSTMQVSKAVEHVAHHKLSRIPVYGEHKEDILGYVLRGDILLAAVEKKFDLQVHDLKRNILTASENISLKDLFSRMNKRHEHICALVDEYGGFSGLITMEDVVETILGFEIVDELDTIEDMQKLARKNWRIRASRNGIQVEDH